jgi:hypothetical protein
MAAVSAVIAAAEAKAFTLAWLVDKYMAGYARPLTKPSTVIRTEGL